MNRYEMRVQGHLDQHWSDWLDGLSIHYQEDGTTMLRGQLADEAALYGVLMKIRDLTLPLLSVRQVKGDDTHGNGNGEQRG